MNQKKDVAHILKGAYQVVSTAGWNQLTARAVAKASDMSTQPIYLAFRSMDELQETLINRIFITIRQDYFRDTSNLSQFLTNYYRFALENKAIYFSLIAAGEDIRQKTESFFYTLLFLSLETEIKHPSLSEHETKFLLTRIESIILGMLKTEELFNNQKETEELLMKMIEQDVETIIDYRKVSFSCSQ